jgi:tripartite-type tricarboxylate transporter receptor subunit TctC
MKEHLMRRRDFLGMAGGTLAAGLSSRALAQAPSWPTKPVKLVLPYAPGGATDLLGRPWAEKLSQAFGQQFVIENRGGAAGMIGTEAAAKAAPDGYTFLLTPNATISVLPNMRRTPYDPPKSFVPVARVGDLVCGFVIHPKLGLKTFKEMVDYAKANPGKLTYASAGLGTSTHLRIEMLKFRAGIDILHVPYRGSADALNDLLPGTVHMMNEINVLPHVKAGKLILLNINHTRRHPDFPDVPTLTEHGITNADVPIWYSVWAPAGTSKDITDKLNARIVEIAKTDEMKARMRGINVEVPIQTPEQMLAHLISDTARNGEVIKAANIKLE